MKIIKEANKESMKFIGNKQIKTKGKTYRWNKYCIFHKYKDVNLIYCTMSGAIVALPDYEFTNVFTEDPCNYQDFLIENYFLIPENFDEQALTKHIKEMQQIPITDNYLDHPSKFVILTTTQCNARCFYCYEKNSVGKHHMTNENAEKIAKYIVDYHAPGKKVDLSWFGGEPLYNADVISIISSRIKQAGIEISSTMITNGYLFSDKLINLAVNEWNLRHVQITLDGTQDKYNKIKNYIYDEKNPYGVVINNIKKLLKNNIGVSIRMNLDLHNADDLLELTKQLGTEIKDKNFTMYAHELFECNGFERDEEHQKKVYDKMIEMNKLLYSLGYTVSGKDCGRSIQGTHCMVDCGSSVVISPDGDLGVCEHYIDSGFFSHISNPTKKNIDVFYKWREYTENTDRCNDCSLYPICLMSKGCPDANECNDHFLRYKNDSTIRQLQFLYDSYKSCQCNQNGKQQKNSCCNSNQSNQKCNCNNNSNRN